MTVLPEQWRSDTLAKLATALAKAQGEMGHALKDSVNPHFNSKYADLAANIDAARGPLTANGLSVSQLAMMDLESRCVGVKTVLMHTSGEYLISTLTLPVDKGTAQAAGSALTYARRYSFAAMVGLAQDDDDGNAASEAGGGRPAPPKPKPKPTEPEATRKQYAEIKALLTEVGFDAKDNGGRAKEIASHIGRKFTPQQPVTKKEAEDVIEVLTERSAIMAEGKGE